MTMTMRDKSFSARLRTATKPCHDRAEAHPLQRSLLKGALPRPLYARQLGQLLLVHRALESAIRAAAARDDRLFEVACEEHFQAPRISADLAHLGVDSNAERPTPATSAFITRIDALREQTPIALLGLLYVLEGSNNGGRFIARAVRKAYGFDDGAGATFLDPYGQEQPAKWARFKAALDSCALTNAEADAIVSAAGEMYDAISAIGDDLFPSLNAV